MYQGIFKVGEKPQLLVSLLFDIASKSNKWNIPRRRSGKRSLVHWTKLAQDPPIDRVEDGSKYRIDLARFMIVFSFPRSGSIISCFSGNADRCRCFLTVDVSSTISLGGWGNGPGEGVGAGLAGSPLRSRFGGAWRHKLVQSFCFFLLTKRKESNHFPFIHSRRI